MANAGGRNVISADRKKVDLKYPDVLMFSQMKTNTFKTESIQTGIAPSQLKPATAPLYVPQERNVTQKEKVELWFIDPLMRLKGDDGFVCLLICCPLLEAIIRLELEVPDDHDVVFSDNAPALKWFATFMTIRTVFSPVKSRDFTIKVCNPK